MMLNVEGKDVNPLKRVSHNTGHKVSQRYVAVFCPEEVGFYQRQLTQCKCHFGLHTVYTDK